MRKIVTPTEGIRLEAIVEKDGIGFISTKIAGPAAVSFNGRFVTVEEESEEVKVKNINPEEDKGKAYTKSKMDEKIKKRGFIVLMISLASIIAVMLMMFASITSPHAEIWVNVFATILPLILSVSLLSKAVTILLGKIFKDKDMISFTKYLGAKNAVENAFYDLGRAPSMEEVKNYSIYSSEDKYTKSSYMAFLWMLISLVRIFDGWMYWLVSICAIFLVCWLDWKNMLAFIQAMVVSEPDEMHYKVAIAAINDVAYIFNHVDIHFHTIELVPDPENFDEDKCSKNGCPAYDFCKKESQKMAKNKRDDNESK